MYVKSCNEKAYVLVRIWEGRTYVVRRLSPIWVHVNIKKAKKT